MELGAIFFTLAVVTLVGMYVGQPYLVRRGRRATQADHEYSSLLAEYDHVVNTLQELDFDNSLGKVPTEDYPRQRADLLAKGAELLRKLDNFSITPTSGSGRDAESRLEAAVASRRADSAESAPATTELLDEDLEAMIAARRKMRNGKSGGFCPKCGKPILTSDRFCPSCGKAIN